MYIQFLSLRFKARGQSHHQVGHMPIRCYGLLQMQQCMQHRSLHWSESCKTEIFVVKMAQFSIHFVIIIIIVFHSVHLFSLADNRLYQCQHTIKSRMHVYSVLLGVGIRGSVLVLIMMMTMIMMTQHADRPNSFRPLLDCVCLSAAVAPFRTNPEICALLVDTR